MAHPADQTLHSLIATRIRQHRLRLHLTQEQAAAQCQLPLRTYRRFEASGHGNVVTLFAIAAAMDRTQAVENIFPAWQNTGVKGPLPSPEELLSREDKYARILARERAARGG